jgi:microcystin-dependent protein
MSDPFIGQIILFAGNFEPSGWAFCDGRLLPISQNTALFSILGTTYGGDGITNFALPDLRGRVPLHFGQGPGLSNYVQGQSAGAEQVTLTQGQLPAHSHSATSSLSGTAAPANSTDPTGRFLAQTRQATYGSGAPVALDPTSVSTTVAASGGNNQPHNNLQPYLALNYVIALFGIFPSRN